MTIRPLFDRVLLRRKDAESTTASGLHIPAAAQDKNNVAIVVAVGPGRLTSDGSLVATQVEVGQEVLIGKWEGTEVKVEGVDHIMIREDAILAIVEDGAEEAAA